MQLIPCLSRKLYNLDNEQVGYTPVNYNVVKSKIRFQWLNCQMNRQSQRQECKYNGIKSIPLKPLIDK